MFTGTERSKNESKAGGKNDTQHLEFKEAEYVT
jgi:hypothetical protein